MLPGLFGGGHMPGEEFINSFYPIAIALVIGFFFGLRSYIRGPQCAIQEKLNGKTVIVTGANSGIGLEIARILANHGARVVLACRDEAKAKIAMDDIRSTNGASGSDVTFMKLDLASFASVREFASAFNAVESRLDILINNAGIMCHPQSRTEDGFELHFQVNYLSHFLLTNELLDKMKSTSDGGRVINVSAHAYKVATLDLEDLMFESREYKPGEAYSQSKLAVMLFTHYLAKKLEGSNVTVNVVNPGVVKTNIHRLMPFRQNVVVSWTFAPFLWLLMKSARDGAQTAVYCALAKDLHDVSGKYFVDCKLSKAEEIALDDSSAEELWRRSVQLCGITKADPAL